MLSPPSDRGWRRLKIRSDANFSYGHSKWISSGGEKFPDFSQKAVMFGGLALSPLCSERNSYLLVRHRRHLST